MASATPERLAEMLRLMEGGATAALAAKQVNLVLGQVRTHRLKNPGFAEQYNSLKHNKAKAKPTAKLNECVLDDLIALMEGGAAATVAIKQLGLDWSTIQRRRKADATFAARYDAASKKMTPIRDRYVPQRRACGIFPLIEAGLSPSKAGKAIGVTSHIWRKARDRDPEFAARLKAALAVRDTKKPTAEERRLRRYRRSSSAASVQKTLLVVADVEAGMGVVQARRLHKLADTTLASVLFSHPKIHARMQACPSKGTPEGTLLSPFSPRKRGPPPDWDSVVSRVKSGEVLTRILGEPGLPTPGQWLHRRRVDPGFNGLAAELRSHGRWSPYELGRAISAVREGVPLSGLQSQGLAPYWVLKDHRKRNPELAGQIAEAQSAARHARRERLLDRQLRRRAEAQRTKLSEAPLGELFRVQLGQNEIWAAANLAVSRAIPSFIRDDVISEIVADVIEGFLDAADIQAAAKEYVSAYHREAGTWLSRSFDAPMSGSGKRSLHDVMGG